MTVSTVPAIPVPTAIYREEQLFGWWVYALMALMVALASYFWVVRPGGDAKSYPFSIGIFVGLALPTVFTVGVLRMTTVVTPGRLDVTFGWLPTYHRSIVVGVIKVVEVVTYRPIADYGGWGIRSGRDGVRVLNARGNRGVRLTMIDGSRLLIGSQHPEALASALESAIRPSV
jgi:hypothetical protein